MSEHTNAEGGYTGKHSINPMEYPMTENFSHESRSLSLGSRQVRGRGLVLAFNQDHSYFSASGDFGLRIYSVDPLAELIRRGNSHLPLDCLLTGNSLEHG